MLTNKEIFQKLITVLESCNRFGTDYAEFLFSSVNIRQHFRLALVDCIFILCNRGVYRYLVPICSSKSREKKRIT